MSAAPQCRGCAHNCDPKRATWRNISPIVQWDQRGSDKTYLLNDPAKIAPTLTLDRMVEDAEEMADWTRRELDEKKIFVLGHCGLWMQLVPLS